MQFFIFFVTNLIEDIFDVLCKFVLSEVFFVCATHMCCPLILSGSSLVNVN